MNARLFYFVILVLASTVSIFSQTRTTVGELHLRVNKILLKKNLPSLVDELSRTKAVGVDDMLLRLDVYKRAGETHAIRRLVVDLASAPDLPPPSDRKWLLEIVRWNIENDLTALRLYYERLTSDDGSQLFIDDQLVIDNDGNHPPITRHGTVELSAGRHQLRIVYFQGIREELALQLFVSPPGEEERVFSTRL